MYLNICMRFTFIGLYSHSAIICTFHSFYYRQMNHFFRPVPYAWNFNLATSEDGICFRNLFSLILIIFVSDEHSSLLMRRLNSVWIIKMQLPENFSDESLQLKWLDVANTKPCHQMATLWLKWINRNITVLNYLLETQLFFINIAL